MNLRIWRGSFRTTEGPRGVQLCGVILHLAKREDAVMLCDFVQECVIHECELVSRHDTLGNLYQHTTARRSRGPVLESDSIRYSKETMYDTAANAA